MKIGDILTIKPNFYTEYMGANDQPRQAQVIYIHPEGRFYVVEFRSDLGIRWRATEFVSEVEQQLRDMGFPVYRQVIRKSEKVPESTVVGSPLTIYSPRSSAGVDFRRWVREFMGEV